MDESIDKYILQAIARENPETTEQLIELVRREGDFSEEEIINRILILQNEGKITLKKTPISKISTYTILGRAYWYWATLILTGITAVLVLLIPENAYPIVYTRYFFGSFFVLLLPGYALTRALYPAKRLDNTERIGLSIGMSIALVCLDAFLLNFSPWKITISSFILSLSLLIGILATVAILRERFAFTGQK